MTPRKGFPRRARPYKPSLVISIHGIRTHAKWQKALDEILGMSHVPPAAYDFGRYGLIRFLTPTFNERMLNKFYDWFMWKMDSRADIDLDRYDKRPSIVAHSLGSWIVGNAMQKFPGIRFEKAIFAGSILPVDFDWSSLFERDQIASVRNEFSLKDPWPRLASYVVPRTGEAGSKGFDSFGKAVENVSCKWFGHSDSLIRPHIEQQWIPFLMRSPSPIILRHGREIHDLKQFSDTLDHTGTVIDAEAYAKLPNYASVEIPRGLSLQWIRVEPDIYTFLIDRVALKPIGYINAMPVENALYEQIRAGRITDNEIPANGILPYKSGGAVKVYLMSIAIAEENRRLGDGIYQQAYFQLMSGILDKLNYYAGDFGTRVTHMLTTAWTPEGIRISKFLGMNQVGKDKFGDPVFELDLLSAKTAAAARHSAPLKRLLDTYNKM
jgi:hypothetical protein